MSEQVLNNFAVWQWMKKRKCWDLLGRFPTPKAAYEAAGQWAIVIDVSTDSMIWWRGAVCQRAKPHAVPKLELEKYTT